MAEHKKPAQPPNRWRTRPWPWPEDNREDKAKRVALSYRKLLQRITQGQCDDPAGDLHRLDEHWAELDIHWHRPRPDLLHGRDDEWMSARELAHCLDRTRKDIYNWARAGHIQQRCGPDGTPEYHVGSVKAYRDSLRIRRMNQRRRTTTTEGKPG